LTVSCINEVYEDKDDDANDNNITILETFISSLYIFCLENWREILQFGDAIIACWHNGREPK